MIRVEKMTRNAKLREIFKSLGLVLIFIGMQLNTAIRNVLPSIDIVELIMIISVLLISDLNMSRKLHLSKNQSGLIVFVSILFLLALFSNNGTKQLYSFHLYLIALIFAFSTQKNYVTYQYFGRILFYLSGFISVVVCFQATDGFTKLIQSYYGTSKLWLEQGGDPVSVSRALGINIIAILLYKKKNLFEKMVAIIFAIFTIIGLFSFSNRSSIVCVVIVLLLWGWKYYNTKVSFKKIGIGVITIIIIFIIFTQIEYIQVKGASLLKGTINGIATLVGINTSVADVSATTRVRILEEVENAFWQKPIKHLIFGLGYNWTYVDRPVFQAFFDLGIIGSIVYLFYLFWIPINAIMRQLKTELNDCLYNEAYRFVVFIALQSLMDQFYCGLPYFYYLWTPTVFFVCCSFYKRK